MNEKDIIKGKEYSLINSYISSISENGYCHYEVICNNKIVHVEMRKIVADLTMKVINSMPAKVKKAMFDNKNKILEFKMTSLKDTYKFSVKTAEPNHLKFEKEIQEILDSLQTDFEKDFLK
jgi:hypothetical protein